MFLNLVRINFLFDRGGGSLVINQGKSVMEMIILEDIELRTCAW